MPELDAVRGLAVLMVLLYHGFYAGVPAGVAPLGIWPLYQAARGGWLGVQLFFVLSGFLITGILLDTRARSDYWTRFWERRARRILPALLLLLAALAITQQARPGFLLASLLFVTNLAPAFGVPLDYAPLWSLAVEEQFYLFWPFVVRWTTRRTLIAICLSLVIGTPLLRWATYAGGDTNALYYQTWHNTDALAIGALLAIALRLPAATCERVSRLARRVVFGGALLILAALITGALTTRGVPTTRADAVLRNTIWALWCASGIALLLALGRRHSDRLRLRPLEFAGHVSYGLYLVHVLVFRAFDAWISPPAGAGTAFMLARFLAAGTAAIGIAALSRWTVEEWFLRGAPRLSGAGHADGALRQGPAD